ncbi:response regulator [Methylobacterium sp. E-046]|uniref:response regulator n=1 Tax=Methylobacterium sp. E-046 TaxID=2836576 RepID=UPI001FB9B7D2|nr:response regulator [Methylobacterium sp. E-046]MCJ2099802.1 response regulator [Methylobacterium sp. E-046]
MEQIGYVYKGGIDGVDNPLLNAVAYGLAQMLPIEECEDWPQPLLELLARLELPDTEEPTPTPLVVVVGRCPTMVEQAATLLRASALNVECCDTGEEALQALRQRSGEVALVVADQQLTGTLDGFGLIQVLHQSWPGIPIILATEGYQQPRLPPAVTMLPKPWLPLALLVETHRAVQVASRFSH